MFGRISKAHNASGSCGCYYFFLNSVPRGGSRQLYPDAVSNVLHGYAHMKDENKREVVPVKSSRPKKEVVPAKSTTNKKTKPVTSEDEWDEDPFFRALLHNNDDDRRVVKNVVSKSSDERVDEEMFSKLSEKILHRFHRDETEEPEKQEKTTYGIRDLINGSYMME